MVFYSLLTYNLLFIAAAAAVAAAAAAAAAAAVAAAASVSVTVLRTLAYSVSTLSLLITSSKIACGVLLKILFDFVMI